MKKLNFDVSELHENLSQFERLEILGKFRVGSIKVLITSDLIGRGIDLENVGLVINYDMPINKETYINIIGRAGRYGKKGTAITFVLPKDYRPI
jgi:superfamily II DNA/RNA helicase